jgi:hypothetical protein
VVDVRGSETRGFEAVTDRAVGKRGVVLDAGEALLLTAATRLPSTMSAADASPWYALNPRMFTERLQTPSARTVR